MIPARHAEVAASVAPGARVEVLADCGHFPHKEHPERFVEILDDFVATTRPTRHSRATWRRLLTSGPSTGGAPAPGHLDVVS